MNLAHSPRPDPDPLEPVTISITPANQPFPNSFQVTQGNRTCEALGWDEMIGQVIALTHPRIRMAHYPMQTAAERRVERARSLLRRAKADVEKERCDVINIKIGEGA